jgi:hypothetical protein
MLVAAKVVTLAVTAQHRIHHGVEPNICARALNSQLAAEHDRRARVVLTNRESTSTIP